jgi:hypothetical protein
LPIIDEIGKARPMVSALAAEKLVIGDVVTDGAKIVSNGNPEVVV